MAKSVFTNAPFNLEEKRNPGNPPSPHPNEALDEEAVAELSSLTISQMTVAELTRVVKAARLPLLSATCVEHLEFRDRENLERLAHLARRCCCNRTTHHF